MVDIRETVTRTQNNTVQTEQPSVVQETRQTQTSETTDPKTTTGNIVWYIFGFIAILLALRFVFRLTGANPTSGFVNFVYSISGVLSAPFDTIFGVTAVEAGQTQSVFEPSILVAIAVYALIAWGIVRLLFINRKV